VDQEAPIVADQAFERRYLYGFANAPAFIFARAAGLAAVLAADPSIGAVARRFGIDESSARSLLVLLEDMQLISVDGDFAQTTALGRRLLDPKQACETFAPIEAFFRTVLSGLLDQASRLPLPGQMAWPPTDEDSSAAFEPMMTATADYLATWIDDLLPLSTIGSMLDVGGGDGTVAALLCQKHPNLRVDVANLASAAPLVLAAAGRYGVSPRVAPLAIDFRHERLPRGYDTVLFARMLSDWGDSVVRELLGAARDSLSSETGSIWAFESSLTPSSQPDVTDTKAHPWAWFWRICVPGFELHGPRTIAEWKTLAASAGLEVEFIAECGRKPVPTLTALHFVDAKRD
jgi:hypothetical protein